MFISTLTLSYLCGFVLTVLLESPVLALIRAYRSNLPTASDNNNTISGSKHGANNAKPKELIQFMDKV